MALGSSLGFSGSMGTNFFFPLNSTLERRNTSTSTTAKSKKW